MHRLVSALMCCSLLAAAATASALEEFQKRTATSPHGMVAAAHPVAVEAGLRIMSQGGNAVDAAAAVAFAVSVVEPYGSSLGGDGGALIHIASTGEVLAYDYRAQAPSAIKVEDYDYSKVGQWRPTPKGAAVPGMVAGTMAWHDDFGQLPLATVLQPAIEAAENGYTVGPALAGVITDLYGLLSARPELADLYLIDGLPPDAGQTLYNKPLAATLRRLAEKGGEDFQRGQTATLFVEGLRAQGSPITLEDMATYQVVRTQALTIDYRGATIYSAPPPFGGIAVLENLQLLERLPLDTTAGPLAPQNLHLMIEAMKISSSDRGRYSGDPRFVDVPTTYLLSDAFADERVTSINPATAKSHGAAPDPPPSKDPGNTTHFTVVDAQGSAVSVTQTLGGFFGSGVVAGSTGIVMNDQMKNFARRPESPNSLKPGKRMNSTQSPTIVKRDGKLVLAMGSPGNYRIVTTVTQVLVNFLDFGLSLEEAVNLPRLSAGAGQKEVYIEGGQPEATLQGLRERGHALDVMRANDLFFGGVHAVARDPQTGVLVGVADPRRDGTAGGLAEAPAPAAAER